MPNPMPMHPSDDPSRRPPPPPNSRGCRLNRNGWWCGWACPKCWPGLAAKRTAEALLRGAPTPAEHYEQALRQTSAGGVGLDLCADVQ